MQVRIPYTMLFEAQQYLTQNYILPMANYTVITGWQYHILEFYLDEHYQQFCRRFSSKMYIA